MYICDNWYVFVRLSRLSAGPPTVDLDAKTLTSYDIYTLLPPDDGLLASPKHIEL
jgi:hypothetical protein